MPDYSSLPSVTALASIPELAKFPEKIRTRSAQIAIDEARSAIERGEIANAEELAFANAKMLTKRSLVKVYNFSGVILHTGLGRAPIEPPILGDIYLNLEFDLATGKRGDRQVHVRELICELTGAEDALVVNNAAAAVLLTLTTLCKGKQVLLSRGQSVEIGGSFRMPEIVKASGCKLVDVGATNKTYVTDFTNAITTQTVAVLRCHPSNFEIVGFVHEPTTAELAEAAHLHDLLLINDQGNGSLVDFGMYGIPGIETLQSSVAAGADITIGSGDKLLGGPQCGLILGSKDLISTIKKHPIARAVRIDKISLLTLECILHYYRSDQLNFIPIHRSLSIPASTVRRWCELMAPNGALIKETICELGSGSGSGKGVSSFAVVLKTNKPDKLLRDLRLKKIIGRIEEGAVCLDPRCDEMIYHTWSPNEKESSVLKWLNENITECWEKWK